MNQSSILRRPEVRTKVKYSLNHRVLNAHCAADPTLGAWGTKINNEWFLSLKNLQSHSSDRAFFLLKKSYYKSEIFWLQNIWKTQVRRERGKKSPKIQMFYKSWGQGPCLSISVSTKPYIDLEKNTMFFKWGEKLSFIPPPWENYLWL